MSMLELDVKLPELDGLVKNLGLEEGGRAQQHLVKNVARRITNMCRSAHTAASRTPIAPGPGTGQRPHRHPRPHVKLLYFGKVMAGRKRNTLQTKISGTLPRSTVLPVLSGLSAS